MSKDKPKWYGRDDRVFKKWTDVNDDIIELGDRCVFPGNHKSISVGTVCGFTRCTILFQEIHPEDKIKCNNRFMYTDSRTVEKEKKANQPIKHWGRHDILIIEENDKTEELGQRPQRV